MTELVSFGEWVQTRRNHLRYSRTVLAKQIGCSPITIKKIERDERRPSVQIAELLATHLQIPPDKQEDFISRARGEFIPHFGSPIEMSLSEIHAPAEEEDRPKHNLPLQTTPFFGRKSEIAEITTKLNDPSCRLLTIMGAGGMGKTRLAIHVGQQLVDAYTDGATYISLAPVSPSETPEATNPVAAVLADALKASFQGQDPLEKQLIGYLRRKEMLLIFDNFEHLLESASFIGNLIAQAPDIKILTTSRERLDLQEEWLYPLKGLRFQNESTESRSSAVQLFEQKAKQLDPAFELEEQLSAVLEICELVEGMPLALELAATWVRQLSCAEIVAEIRSELDFLATGSRNVPERHRSVRALFDYSWQQMTIKERMVLQRLSVFRGGFDRVAAKAVANASLPLLRGLVDKSLIAIDENGRYQIHELLRQFAAEKLAQSATEETNVYGLHSKHFFDFVSTEGSKVLGKQAKNILSSFRKDMDNIRSAVHWALNHRPEAFTIDFSFGFFRIFDFQGWYLEGESIFSQITTLLERSIKDIDVLKSEPSLPENCIRWLGYSIYLGSLKWRLGQLESAEEILLGNLALLSKTEQKQAQWIKAFCLISLSVIFQYQGKYLHAKELIQESGHLFLAVGDSGYYAFTLFLQGSYAQFTGDYSHSHALLKESERILNELDRKFHLTFTWAALGRLFQYEGQFTKAKKFIWSSLDLRNELNYQIGPANSFFDLGEISRLMENYDEARFFYQKSIQVADESNVPSSISIALWGLGNLANAQGNYALAQHHFDKSGLIAHPRAGIIGGPGWSALGLGQFELAEQIFLSNLQQMLDNGDKPFGLDALLGLACIQANKGRIEYALEQCALVRFHPSSHFEIKMKAHKLWIEYGAASSSETRANAERIGKELDLLVTAEKVFVET